MFGKVKKILGIEGVKIELTIDGPFDENSGTISGVIKLSTKTSSTINSINVRVIEKYSRGRKKAMLIDEYTLGQLDLTEIFQITPEEIIEVPFELEYVSSKSEVDKMAEGNIFLRGPIKLAKFLKKVKSEYRIEAHAEIEGTKLQPFASKTLKS